jgi:hypothetical protein
MVESNIRKYFLFFSSRNLLAEGFQKSVDEGNTSAQFLMAKLHQ